jgi:aldose 1-epimerase
MIQKAIITAFLFVFTTASAFSAFAVGTITKEPFGATASGVPVEIYTLTNAKGLKARIMTYGATVVSLETPDKAGNLADIVLGFDSVAEYEKGSPYFGCIVGRYANRIGGAKFSLDGKEYTLAKNDGENTLHGGKAGFDKVVWAAEIVQQKKGPALKFTYTSKDGEEGYPGALSCAVTYALTDNNRLRIQYEATADKKTVCNLTHHSYFNLSGAGNGDILKHHLEILADKFTPVNTSLIPTGELKDLTGSPLDFRTSTAIGARIDADDEQLKLGKGYDHNYVLRPSKDPKKPLRKAASAHDPASGRTMEVFTTEPGLQFYTGNFLDGKLTGKGGKVYPHRGAFCLEAQKFPDSPNKPTFPTATLEPGQTYKQVTIYAFGMK